METLSRTCMDIVEIGRFCDCISGEEPVNETAKAFCDRAKADKNVTGEDLAELKMALMDDDECCDC